MCHWQYAVLVSTCDTFVESKVPLLLNKALLWVWLDSLSSITNVTSTVGRHKPQTLHGHSIVQPETTLTLTLCLVYFLWL